MRLYSVGEATALLPEVIALVERLRDAFVELRALRASIAAEARGAAGDGHLIANAWDPADGTDRAETLARALSSAAAGLERLGVEVKDPERGLIDFYSEREGEVVYLCYVLGEPGLRYWHSLADGFAGRQPL